MKRLLTLLLSAMLVGAGLCSCGGEKDKASVSDGGTSASSNASSDSKEGGQGSDEIKKIDVTNGLKLLFIGNSHSEDTKQYMCSIARSLGIKNVVIGELHIGGTSLENHADNIRENNAAYFYRKSNGDDWTEESKKTLEYGITDEEWDVVSIQQKSTYQGAEVYMTDEDAFSCVMSYVRELCPNPDFKFVWNMTWAYTDESTDPSFGLYDYSHEAEFRAIVSTTPKTVGMRKDIYMILPTGTAVENAYGSSLKDILYRDSAHLSLLQGRYLAGLTCMCRLTGRDPEEVTYRPLGISDEEFELIKKCAAAAIVAPYEKTNITEDRA